MTDELRAAAERRRRWRECLGRPGGLAESPYANDDGIGFLRVSDAMTLADGFLADHSADDAEPVDEGWLRTVGFTEGGLAEWHIAFGHRGYDKLLFLAAIKEAQIVNLAGDEYGSDDGAHLPDKYPTRGHVRRLCAALGIDLHETTPGGAA
jgi:hypothetical protein